MKDFDKFVAAHKDLIFAVAEKNTTQNENGRAVIERDDPWFYEDEWDDYARKVDTAARA